MERNQVIAAAIVALETSNDNHWTNAGMPDMSELKERTGFADLTRSEVSGIAPDYTREKRYDLNVTGQTTNQDGAHTHQIPVVDNSLQTPADPEHTHTITTAGGEQNAGDNQAQNAQEGEAVKDQAAEASSLTPTEVVELVNDPLVLIEAAIIAAADDRYTRNSPLHSFLRHFLVDQNQIREYQKRIDKRQEERVLHRERATS